MNQRRLWLDYALPIALGSATGLGARTLQKELRLPTVVSAVPSPTVDPPTREPAPKEPPATPHAQGGAPAPTEDLTEVLAQIAELEERLTPEPRCDDPERCPSIFAPSQAMLEEWARCAQLPVDVPGALLDEKQPWFSQSALDRVDATEDERAALERATAKLSQDLHSQLVALHDGIVGSAGAADRPTPALLKDLRGMQNVVDEKGEDRRRVAHERAGRPIEGDSGDTGMVAYYRFLLRLGDQAETAAASVLGTKRAHAMREAGRGWGSRITNLARCDGE